MSTVERYPRVVLSAAILLAIVSLVYSGLCLGFKTSRDDLVCPSESYLRHWKAYEQEFGAESDIIVAVEGTDRRRMIAAIETLADRIRQHPHHFEKLCHRIRIDTLKQKGLFQLPLEEVALIRGRIEPLRPLLLGGWSWMSLENVLRAARFRLNHLPGDQPLDDNSRQLIDSAVRLEESLTQSLATGTYASPWRDLLEAPSARPQEIPEYFFSPNGKLAFLTVLPIRDTGSFTGTAEPVARLRQIVADLRPHFPELDMGVTGMPVLEADEMSAAVSSGGWSMLISLGGVILIFIAGFRALRHPAYAILTILISFAWMLGWTTLTIGHLNIISASFIATLIGLGDDFWILWLSRYEADRCRGIGVFGANVHVAGAVGPGIVVGAATTALSFFCTMSTGFLGLREMGWITGSGMLIFLIGVLTVLPALLVVGGRQQMNRGRARWDDLEAFAWLAQHPRLVLAAFAIVAVLLARGIPAVRFDYNLLHLQAHGTPAVIWEHKLLEETNTSGWYALSIADSAEAARERKRQFEQLPTVGKVVEIASLLPTDQEKKAPLIREIQQALARLPEVEKLAEQSAPRLPALEEALSELAGVDKPGFQGADKELLRRLRAGAASARQSLEQMPSAQRVPRLAEYESKWVRDLLAQLHQLRAAANPRPVTIDDLPLVLRERYLSPGGKWLLQIFAKESVWDIEPLRRFCAELASVDESVTGKPISTLWSLTQMTEGYARSTQWALLFCVAAVWLDLRRVRDVLLASIPLAFGVTVMFGFMGWSGIHLNPANMIALPLITGIGIDAGVHLVHDFREQAGTYRLSWRLARAMVLTCSTTVIGFASLASAQHWGIITTGIVISVGVAASGIAALLLLPSVLKLLTTRAETVTIAIEPVRSQRRAA